MKLDTKHLAVVVFCAFAIKLLIVPEISVWQAACLLISGIFLAFNEYKASVQQIKDQQQKLDLLQVEVNKLSKIQQDIISSVSSVKIAQNMKSQLGMR